MPQQNNNQPCKMCSGSGGVVVAGTAQVCPMCDGSGKQFVPGLLYHYGIMVALTALQTVQQSINILNAPFKWIFATSTQTGPFTVFLADAKNQRQFMNVPLHYSLLFGTGTNPFPVLNPWVFDQNGTIQITFTDLSNANNTVWLDFIGVQLVQSQSQSAGGSSSS